MPGCPDVQVAIKLSPLLAPLPLAPALPLALALALALLLVLVQPL